MIFLNICLLMEGVNIYGDLTDKELHEFLAEIENEDDELQETQDKALENIAREEIEADAIVFTEEELENRKFEAQYCGFSDKTPPLSTSDKEEVKISTKRNANQKLWGLKKDRLKIQQEAFNQDVLPLSSVVEIEDLKKLIELLVSEHTRLIDKYHAYINTRLTTLISPLIPKQLKLCRKQFPNSVRVSPGFLYKASKEYGAGLTFWATPDVPYYFKQNSENELLRAYKSYFLMRVDIAVKNYHTHYNARTEKEIKYASMIYNKSIKTYFDLLKLNPFWFKILLNNKTK